MKSAVRGMGNSASVIIPKSLLAEIGAKVGDVVELRADGGRIVIVPVRGHPRATWADDAMAIAEAGEDDLAWPEFGNADDAAPTW
jgi:antitoxin MazE